MVATRRVTRGTLLMVDSPVAYLESPEEGNIPSSDDLMQRWEGASPLSQRGSSQSRPSVRDMMS